MDGDGGDENLKDYPIEENAELTIRSVVNNRMLYQEGWGCDSLKHSLIFSGGYSRACVRTYASLRRHGFLGFSPFTCPPVVAVAEAIPFAALTDGSPARLYALKGEIVARGVRAVLGAGDARVPEAALPARRGAPRRRRSSLAAGEAAYRSRFLAHYQA